MYLTTKDKENIATLEKNVEEMMLTGIKIFPNDSEAFDISYFPAIAKEKNIYGRGISALIALTQEKEDILTWLKPLIRCLSDHDGSMEIHIDNHAHNEQMFSLKYHTMFPGNTFKSAATAQAAVKRICENVKFIDTVIEEVLDDPELTSFKEKERLRIVYDELSIPLEHNFWSIPYRNGVITIMQEVPLSRAKAEHSSTVSFQKISLS